MVLTAVVVLPGAQAVHVDAPQPVPNTPLVSVAVTFDDPDVTQLAGLFLHFSCDMGTGDASEFLTLDTDDESFGVTDHAILIDLLDGDTGGFGYGYDPETGGYGYLIPGAGAETDGHYGYLQTGQTGYGYLNGEHGVSTGYTSPVASGYGYGIDGSGYGYGFDSGTLTFVFLMIEETFDPNEECTLVVEVVPVGHPSGSFEGPRSAPFTPRIPPVADAGADLEVAGGQQDVALDGSLSYDPNDSPEPLNFTWSQVDGTPVTLSDAYAAEPTFDAPEVEDPETLTFELIVSDGLDPMPGDLGTAVDTVTVTVSSVVADAGEPGFATEGRTYALDGTGSRTSTQHTLTYAWTQVGEQTVTLSGANTATPSFTVPDVDEDTPAVFRLTVHAGPYSDTDEVTITFIEQEPPTVDAGPAAVLYEGIPYTLQGAATDRNGDPLEFAWTFVSGPRGEIDDPSELQPTFMPPEVDSTKSVVLRLNVSDEFSWVADTVTFEVHDNRAPIADARASATVALGDLSFELDGHFSVDPDGDTLDYEWSVASGPVGLDLTDEDTSTPSLSFEAGAQPGMARFLLAVYDRANHGQALVAMDDVEVLVSAVPVLDANAGPDLKVPTGGAVTLLGDASTGAAAYSWTQLSGTPVTLENATTALPTFTAPPLASVLTFKLAVSDATAPTPILDDDQVTVTVVTGTAGGAPQEFFLHTKDCTLVDPPVLPASTNTFDNADGATPGADGDTELCLRPTVPLAAAATSFTGSGQAAPAGTAVTGTLHLALLLPSGDLGTGLPQDVEVVLRQGGAEKGRLTATYAGAGGIAYGLLGSLPAATPTFLPYTFEGELDAALAAGAFSFDVVVPPVNGLAYIVGLEPGHASSFEVAGHGALVGTPAANAGPDQTKAEGQSVTLGSPAVAGHAYSWTQYQGPAVALSSGAVAQPTFTAPQVQGTTTLRFRVTATNADGLTSFASRVAVTVTNVVAPDAAPRVDVALVDGESFEPGQRVTLGGTVRDYAGDFLTAEWEQPSGVPVGGTATELSNAGGVATFGRSFIIPDVESTTTMSFRLLARDNHFKSGFETLSFVVEPSVQEPASPDTSAGGTIEPPATTTPPAGTDGTPATPPGSTPTTPATPTTPVTPPQADRDSDGDGVPDRIEILLGTDPFAAGDVPSFDISSQLKVRRLGDANILTWAGQAHAAGYQVWSSNSPYTLLATTDADESALRDDAGLATTKYKLTFFVERTAAGGYLEDASGLSTLSGWDAQEGTAVAEPSSTDSEAAKAHLSDWAVGAVVLGVALIACILAVVLLARRRK